MVDHLAEHPDEIELGGERRELSFVCTDMANYTPFIEQSEAAIAVKTMNEYISGLCSIVLDHEGTIDTVVGDALVAMFGAPVSQSDHAQRAVACALALDQFASNYQIRKNQEGIPIGKTRIGVHTGSAVVGNLGGDTYFHYTAQGDAIVTAARLENANKYLGTRICVSESTGSLISEFEGREIGILKLKGKQTGIRVYEPVQGYSPDYVEAYQHAFQMLRDNDPDTVKSFAALVGKNQEDALARFHLRRLLAGEQGTEINIGKLAV